MHNLIESGSEEAYVEATKRANDENAVDTLRITMISAVAAPLVAHWLDTFLGSENNPWTGEKLMVLFFSLISGRVIFMVIEKGYRKTRLYAKGFNLHNAELTETIIWTLPCAFVVTLYDTLFGATAVIVMFTIALFIMTKGKNLIAFNRKSYFEFRFYSLLAIILRIKHPVSFSPAEGVKMFSLLLVTSFFSWLLTETAEHAIKKFRQKRKQKKSKKRTDNEHGAERKTTDV